MRGARLASQKAIATIAALATASIHRWGRRLRAGTCKGDPRSEQITPEMGARIGGALRAPCASGDAAPRNPSITYRVNTP